MEFGEIDIEQYLIKQQELVQLGQKKDCYSAFGLEDVGNSQIFRAALKEQNITPNFSLS